MSHKKRSPKPVDFTRELSYNNIIDKQRADMKTLTKLLIAGIAVAMSTAAVAQPRGDFGHRGGHSHHHSGGNWVAPLVIGGVIGAVIASQPREVYVQPAPVYIPPRPVYPEYTPRTMWRRVDVYIPECNCYRTIDVQVQ